MAHVEDLYQVALHRARQQWRVTMQRYGDAWAASVRRAAPVAAHPKRGEIPGTLRDSISFHLISPEEGELVMVGYGRFVDRGYRIWNWGLAARPRRPYKTRGFQPANRFVERGAEQAGLAGTTPDAYARARILSRAAIKALLREEAP